MDAFVLTDLDTWGPWLIQWGANLLTAMLILGVGWWLSNTLGRTVQRAAERSPRIDATIVPMVRTVAVWAIRVFTLIAVLARFGVQTASLIAVLGAAGLAIGLALQGTLQNIAAGIMLISLRPIRAGEYVLFNNIEGTVAEVGLFLTRITQPDGVTTTVPNSVVWNATITNNSRNSRRRLDIQMIVRYGDDLDRAIETMRALIVSHPLSLDDPAPQVLVMDHRENGVVVLLRMWAEAANHWTLRCDLHYQLRKQLEAAHLRAPIPVRGYEQERVHEAEPPKAQPQPAPGQPAGSGSPGQPSGG
ncbi:mechanosensitive ion channel domain-containing protein [Orrella sp. JC864]|uniref:mechanosensitive ion channel family protein n=1 Tax=Orrella sp. JC864 TaxID=3120298 RepID=UPI00300BF511